MDSPGKSSSVIVPMDANERIRRFGIECLGSSGGDGIFFQAGKWRPGGEYIQKLHIKNVSTSVKKLKYRLPSTRYFSLAYPEVITLSPGMFKIIDVIFRPVEHLPYDDFIYVKMLDGIEGNGFHVPVRATIDKLILEAPSGLDFGYCPTHQVTTKVFSLENTGEVDAPYYWDVPAPFELSPMSGVIPAGRSQEIIVRIVPLDASVFVPSSGTILPLSEVTVVVRYTPLAMGCYSLDRYHFRTPGNCNTLLTCCGMTMPPKVTLYKQPTSSATKQLEDETAKNATSTQNIFSKSNSNDSLIASMQKNEGAPIFSLNFRDVEVGKVETRAYYSIIADSNGVFKMNPKQGKIPALFKAFPVTVVFAPTKPNNYYRRHAHVQAYRNRSVQGLGRAFGESSLDSMSNLTFFANIGRAGTRALSVATLQRPVTRTGETIRPLASPAHEFFISQSDLTCREITINKTILDFGFTPYLSTSSPKVVVDWQIPFAHGITERQIEALTAESDREKDIITEEPTDLSIGQRPQPHSAMAFLTGGNCKDGKLVFPCCYEGESTYQTFMLRNTSNLPSTFQIGSGGSDPEQDVFSVKPAMGEVAAEDFVLVCVKFSPQMSGKLMLEGAGALPYLLLPDMLLADATDGAELGNPIAASYIHTKRTSRKHLLEAHLCRVDVH
eukprot:gene25376-33916_t